MCPTKRAPPDRAAHKALEAELRRLSNAVKLAQKSLADVDLVGASAAESALRAAAPIDGALGELAERLRAAQVERAAGADALGRLSRGLRAACAEASLPLSVEGHAPLRLRVDPIVFVVDVEGGVADLVFAERPLGQCRAEAGAMLAARSAAVAALEGPTWSAADFHAQLRAVWAELGGGWCDLTAALPGLCLRQQSPAFLQDPRPELFRGYPRAQLAYDLRRLRRDRALSVAGWRLCVAPATGGSLRDKNDVLMLDDGDGRGQWHRSFCFVPEDAP